MGCVEETGWHSYNRALYLYGRVSCNTQLSSFKLNCVHVLCSQGEVCSHVAAVLFKSEAAC